MRRLLLSKRTALLYSILFICAVAFSQQYKETKHYESNPKLGGDVVINKLTNEVKGNSSYSSFEVKVPASGNYYISFWLCPSKLSNGRFTEYDVLVNNSYAGKIKPSRSDWQAISLDGNKTIRLEEGNVTISVKGSVPDIPSVEFVRLSKDKEKAKISDAVYRKYKDEITEISKGQATENNNCVANTDTLNRQISRRVVSFPLGPQSHPPYDANYLLGLSISYTFYKKVCFLQNQNVSITTTGIDNFNHVLELFSATTPQSNSWASLSYYNCEASINLTIPETGYYYVRVRSFRNGRLGMCNLNINNTNQYDSVAVYSYGLRNNKGIQSVYNSFTCYNTGDPIIWVEEDGLPGHITAYNDDYQSSSSDYDWDYNSRVKKQYAYNTNAILLSAYSSYDPYCTCDVYCNCLSAYETVGDNFIQSAPATSNYICASWAGGIYTAAIWPPNVFSGIVEPGLESFDLFFDTLRYVGCSTFTRQGATESNSVIDLWRYNDLGIEGDYSHTSVRKGADNNAHGFDWESKMGPQIRVYHPRYHNPLLSLGSVTEHYRRVNIGLYSSLEEAIACGKAAYENVHFTQEEGDYVEQQIRRIPPFVLSQFYTLYDKWTDAWNSSLFSDPDKIADCDEYKELLSYCRSNDLLKYAVYKILDEGNVNAICPLKDLTLKDNRALLEKVFKANRERPTNDKGVRIFRTMQSNAMLYVKELLMAEAGQLRARELGKDATGISYSNSNEFTIRIAGNTIVLIFELDNHSKACADVIDLQGNIVAELIKNRQLQAGSYVYQCEVPKGVYLVRYIINGNVNVKKISLQ